ncbi:hypothetical protein LOTGIDRAFT_159555 [Lottia gigantea]|uniref:IGFBP N-terminal domain-containing protein n=1 Tax=Lottia gigantea TaxID=225164 RepID=V3ZZ36_LOTGI|nr:hypothetical protein LOTGIDRAFT_159555 [Lottia gigantea]ESO96813.1 hypothetical protein LOTGIDRAFT_159555 [Lottia gigantea]
MFWTVGIVFIFLFLPKEIKSQCPALVKGKECCPTNTCPTQPPCSILMNQLGPFGECIYLEAKARNRQPAEIGHKWILDCRYQGLCKYDVGACQFIEKTIVTQTCYRTHRIRVSDWKKEVGCE